MSLSQPVLDKPVVLAVDFSQSEGGIRALNGVNLAPPLSNQDSGKDLNPHYQALHIPYARLHDAPLDNPGMRLVDVQHIFGNWDADVADPANFYFEQTDDYIRNCRALGTDIIYRLGTSIEHSRRRYYAHPPRDFQKWADVCINIIRHYNEGWADGHAWNIRYWEIWNEPDLKPAMWSGSIEDYCRLYALAARQIKQRFPDVKVGGPALAGLDDRFIEAFLDTCRREKAPLDFFSWHSYGADLRAITQQPWTVRQLLDRNGFAESELHLNEWHYFPGDWRKLRSDPQYAKAMFDGSDGLNGMDGAAFLAAALTAWQDTPLTLSNYYTGSFIWGLFERGYLIPYKTYHAAWAFGQMLEYPDRARATSDSDSVRVLAGTSAQGSRAVLISAFKSDATEIEVRIAGTASIAPNIVGLDRDHDLDPVTAIVSQGRIVLRKPPGSAVFLLKLRD